MGNESNESCTKPDENLKFFHLYQNNNENRYNLSNNNKRTNLNSSYNGFCGNISNQDVIYNKKKTEIDLTTTFSSAKGTYTKESYRLFSEKEKTFFYLVQRNNISGIRYLIIQGVNINILDEERTSPLHIACKESSIQTIEEIIFQGSMINIPDLVGWTPLHMACYYNRPDVVLLLLKSGANYNTHNRDKLSARDLAIKHRNYYCVKVLDNFMKYQQIEREKCLKEINNDNYDYNNDLNEEIYEEILKKYITYQKLKREYLQNNEAILSCNDLDLSKNDESESNSDVVNDEFYPTAQVQKNFFEKIELRQIEKCLNVLSSQMSQRKEKEKYKQDNKKRYNLLLSKYKFIPKKHRFYLKYKYKNGYFIININDTTYNHYLGHDKNNMNLTLNNKKFLFDEQIKNNGEKKLIIKNELNLIHLPSSIPVIHTMKHLNNINTRTKFLKKENNINNAEEDLKKNEAEAELYRPYNYGDDDDYKQNSDFLDEDENEINLDVPLNELYRSNSGLDLNLNKNNEDISEDDDKTINLDEENINVQYSNNFLINNYKDQKILLKPFVINKNPDKSVVQYFLAHNDVYEELLQIIFHFDYFFGLQFLMTISDIDNSLVSLINYVSSNIYNSRLRLEILNLMNCKNKSTILESYFTLITSNDKSIFANIKKILKLFDLTTNDIKLIDQLSYSFAKIYYNYTLNNNNNNLFKSQNAVYFFVFSFLMTQITYNQNNLNQFDKEKIICDMIIMLKDLNEGNNYDNSLIKEAINEIKKNNEPVVTPYMINNYDKKLFSLQFRRSKDNILSSYYGYFYNGVFIILNNKKEIMELINLQLDKNLSCKLIPHSCKICFTSLQNKIIEIINIGNTMEFKKSLFFEIYISNNIILNNINKYFQKKRGFNIENNKK